MRLNRLENKSCLDWCLFEELFSAVYVINIDCFFISTYHLSVSSQQRKELNLDLEVLNRMSYWRTRNNCFANKVETLNIKSEAAEHNWAKNKIYEWLWSISSSEWWCSDLVQKSSNWEIKYVCYCCVSWNIWYISTSINW